MTMSAASDLVRSPSAQRPLRPALLGALLLGLGLVLAGPAAAAGAADEARAVQPVRLLQSRSHAQCPIAGKKLAVLSVDSPQEYDSTITLDDVAFVGRPVRWSRERVLVYAMAEQPVPGTQLESASRTLTLNSGVLMWPVREIRPATPPAASGGAMVRPCLAVIVKRALWQRIRIVRKH